MDVTIKGNIVTIHDVIAGMIPTLIYQRRLTCVTIMKTGELEGGVAVFDVSYPMTKEDHVEYAGHIHRYNAEQRKKDKQNGPKGDGPKGPNPPTGGTPGAAKAVEFSKTIAIAA